MEKIGTILKDKTATNFVVVCIAEFLSINETRRLLAQLQLNEVGCSHVIVNQVRKVVRYAIVWNYCSLWMYRLAEDDVRHITQPCHPSWSSTLSQTPRCRPSTSCSLAPTRGPKRRSCCGRCEVWQC